METRTSETHPLRIDWVPVDGPGRLGLSFAPGKCARSFLNFEWRRDLHRDLDVLVAAGVESFVCLLEDRELGWLRIPTLPDQARRRFRRFQHLPIPDGEVPDLGAARDLIRELCLDLEAGRAIFVHCRGGLGRAGTIAACALVARGAEPEHAISRVRAARPGAIENARQEQFVRVFSESSRV